MKTLLITIFYQPLYNGLVLLLSVLPSAEVGLAVILFTVIVKLFLMPLTKKSLVTQIKLKKLEPEIAALKEKYKDNVQQQGLKMMELYRSNEINPFSGFFLILIQIPIIISLYYIFLRGGLPNINTELLYSFVPVPVNADMHLFGTFNLAGKSIVFALLAGITQFIQIWQTMPPQKKDESKEFNVKTELARSMNMQMRYVMPILMTFIAYRLSAVVALYWTTSNIFSIGQEYFIKKRIYGKEEKA